MSVDNKKSRILIVGAGALGLFFGQRLQAGGAEVHYLLKPQKGTGPYRIDEYQKRGKIRSIEFAPDGILDSITSVLPGAWSQIWLCVQSTALTRDWLDSLRERAGCSTIVTIAQDVSSIELLHQVWPDGALIEVTPNVFAFQASSGGIDSTPLACWVPDGAFAVAGLLDRATDVAAGLAGGGLKSKCVGFQGQGEISAALVMPYVIMLEAQGWSLKRTQKSLRLPARAAREAANAIAAMRGAKSPPSIATWPSIARLALTFMARTAPFDFESYLVTHFSKISRQTRAMLKDWIEVAKSRQMPHSALEELAFSLPRDGEGNKGQKIALVTGAGSGIGAATAVELSHKGYHVVAADIEMTSCQRLADSILARGRKALALRLDVSNPDHWQAANHELDRRFGRLDLLVNNAGLMHIGDLGSVSMDDWRRLRAVNLDGALLGIKAMLPLLERSSSGVVVNMASTNAIKASPYDSLYGATKGAIIRLTELISEEFARRGMNIRAHSVLPGPIDTALLGKVTAMLLPGRGPLRHVFRRLLQSVLKFQLRRKVPLGRLGTPKDIAAGVALLASLPISCTHSSMLVIDGGFSG